MALTTSKNINLSGQSVINRGNGGDLHSLSQRNKSREHVYSAVNHKPGVTESKSNTMSERP